MDMEGKYYRAPLGGGTIVVTIVAFLIVLFSLLPLLFINLAIGVFSFIVIGVILLFCYFPIPKGYFIGDNGIVISRRTSDISIPYDDILEIEYVGREMLISYFSIGVRGWFGWSCTAYYGRYGWVKVYSRRLIKMVLIYTRSGDIYAIAPEYPEDFIGEVEAEMNRAGIGMVDDEEGEIEDTHEVEFAEVVDY